MHQALCKQEQENAMLQVSIYDPCSNDYRHASYCLSDSQCMGHDRGGEEAASALSRAFIELKTCNAVLLDALTNVDKRSGGG
ncbi:hypothetical protein Tco_0570095 [Tanacetum coccineum]